MCIRDSPLDYATQFTADCYADGSTLLTIPDAQAKFLVRPEGAATLHLSLIHIFWCLL